jgi:hypothetical protein
MPGRRCAFRDEIGDWPARFTLGEIHQRFGRHAETLVYLLRAPATATWLGDRRFDGVRPKDIGDSLAATGEPAAARAECSRAVATFAEIGHPRQAAMCGELGR